MLGTGMNGGRNGRGNMSNMRGVAVSRNNKPQVASPRRPMRKAPQTIEDFALMGRKFGIWFYADPEKYDGMITVVSDSDDSFSLEVEPDVIAKALSGDPFEVRGQEYILSKPSKFYKQFYKTGQDVGLEFPILKGKWMIDMTKEEMIPLVMERIRSGEIVSASICGEVYFHAALKDGAPFCTSTVDTVEKCKGFYQVFTVDGLGYFVVVD